MPVLTLLIPLLSAVMATTSSARADDVPNLNVEQLCRGIASQSSDPMAENYPQVSFERCMRAEQEDRETLQKEWSAFTPDDKKHCVAEAKTGGDSSYTDLMTCLEMARDVRNLKPQNQQKQE